MKTININQILNAYNKHNYPIFRSTQEKPFNLNIGGIRSNDQDTSRYNDLIYVFYNEGNNWILKTYLGTTDPGLYYLLNLLNPKGAAYLVPGFYSGV